MVQRHLQKMHPNFFRPKTSQATESNILLHFLTAPVQSGVKSLSRMLSLESKVVKTFPPKSGHQDVGNPPFGASFSLNPQFRAIFSFKPAVLFI